MEDYEGIVSSYPDITLGAVAAHPVGSTERRKGILRKAGILPCSSVGDYGIFVKSWRAAGSQRQQHQKGEYSSLHDSKYNKKEYIREIIAINTMKKILSALCILAASACSQKTDEASLSLVPPGLMTDKVELDIRAGVVNRSSKADETVVSVYLNEVSEGSLVH